MGRGGSRFYDKREKKESNCFISPLTLLKHIRQMNLVKFVIKKSFLRANEFLKDKEIVNVAL